MLEKVFRFPNVRVYHHFYAQIIYTIIAKILKIIVLIPAIEISNVKFVSSLILICVKHIIKTIGGMFWLQMGKLLSFKTMVVITASEKQHKASAICMKRADKGFLDSFSDSVNNLTNHSLTYNSIFLNLCCRSLILSIKASKAIASP